ncbi:hypothetical protein Syun_016561 [Stephania yunnanensis]|uniref:Cupin type-1 domain-containing protein n=1 Tax=Stephania yunnanensis TaxID=152371 RepID=A0AAP0P2K6_9MAGN
MSPKLAFLTLLFLFNSLLVRGSDPDPIQDFCLPEPDSTPPRPARTSNSQCKDPAEAKADDFIFSGIKFPANFTKTGFASTAANPTVFPGLNTLGMSFVRADLDVGGINPPHYHPRATEIAFVLKGMVYSGFVDSKNRVFARGIRRRQYSVSFNSQNPGLQRVAESVFGSGIKYELLMKAFGLTEREVSSLRRRFMPKPPKE